MNKEVIVKIKGEQFSNGEDANVETVTKGTYAERNGKKFISYEESPDGEAKVKTLVKLDGKTCEISKKGSFSVNMIFTEGEENLSDYFTPYGTLKVKTKTKSLKCSEADSEIRISIDYDMDLNDEYLGKCKIDMIIAET